MNNTCKIITYHYVRDLKNSRYPNIKGLDYDLFKKQIEYIKANYNPITMEMLIDSIHEGTILPDKAVLLAFDDGYLDHYTNVCPILNNHGIQGSFFVPAQPILNKEEKPTDKKSKLRLLDVNKIHYILASTSIEKIITCIMWFLDVHRDKHNLKSYQEYVQDYSEINRFDDDDTMFVKRFLQKWDNYTLKEKLIDKLFEELVGVDQDTLANELYLNLDQLKDMKTMGMYIGAHTLTHPHLGAEEELIQSLEIATSRSFLLENELCDENYLTLSYPYGSHNQTTKNILKSLGFKLGIGISHGDVNVKTVDEFDIPRFDCNDLTKKMSNETEK